MKSEGAIIADFLASARELSKMYFNILRDTDIKRRFKSEEGIELNSAFWVIAHLAVTQNFLVLRCSGGPKITIPWARDYGLGSTGASTDSAPSFEEVWETFKSVHNTCMEWVSGLSEEQLNAPAINGFNFMTDGSIRGAIMHAVRHEGLHTGHLSWICKLNGIKTI